MKIEKKNDFFNDFFEIHQRPKVLGCCAVEQ